MNNTTPENISKKLGHIKVQPEYLDEWKAKIRKDRDLSLKTCEKSMQKVYRSDAKDLISLASLLRKNNPFEVVENAIDELDTIVRDQIPDKLYDLIF